MLETIPVADQRDPAPSAPGSLRSLLVAGSRFDRSLVRYSAERGGIAIDFLDAANLAEAREVLAAHDFDLIIVDRQLPDGDGLEVPLELVGTARNAGMPIIVLSREDDGDLLATMLGENIHQIAKHDLSPGSLARVVRSAMPGRSQPQATGHPGGGIWAAARSEPETMPLDRIRPIASRLVALVTELRHGMDRSDPATSRVVDEISELTLMLWIDVDAQENAGVEQSWSRAG